MTKELKSKLDESKDDLLATLGVTDSGTPACRLWISLNRLVKAIESEFNKGE